MYTYIIYIAYTYVIHVCVYIERDTYGICDSGICDRVHADYEKLSTVAGQYMCAGCARFW